MPTDRNNAPEIKPWLIIWKIAPSMPCWLNAKIPMVTKPICATEEYAISFFISVCASAISEVRIIAATDRKNTKFCMMSEATGNIGKLNRRKP